jgi:predicted short-subunit dehydrogenase-like oxidoreductase (DUF2520 family)
MRELERDDLPSPLSTPLTVVGRGNVGRSLAAAAERAGIEVALVSHEAASSIGDGAIVLLCVPDDRIAATVERLTSAHPSLIGHTSGATIIDPLIAAMAGAGAFSLHPLQTFADAETPVEGTPAAIAGSSEQSLGYARSLAEALGMRPFEVPEEKRAAYHAAAAMASNLLVTLEESAAEVLDRIGIHDGRQLLAPLVLRTAANWAERGPAALTGPIARGDRETVQRHRVALAENAPEHVRLYDVLAARTEAIAWESVHGVSS